MDLLKWFFGMFVLLGVIWYAGGGAEIEQRPFVRPPATFGSVEQYGKPYTPPTKTTISSSQQKLVGEDEQQKEQEPLSIFDGKVSFQRGGAAYATDPDKEYITLVASPNNLQPINITNWKIKSAITGRGLTLGKGTYLPYSGRVNLKDPIFLRPGETAVVVTGHSPIGVSFRLNTCTGYFEQFQDFTPRLPLHCPQPIEEDYPTGINGLDDACLDYLETLRPCAAQVTSVPLYITNTCNEYLSTQITYNGCVENYKGEDSFYKPEWRIFLRRNEELWKAKRETILLLDEAGKTVDSFSY